MAGIEITFDPWRRFRARKRSDVIQRWLRAVADASERAFKGGMGNYPPASAPGAWPNIRSGRLRRSIRTVVHGDRMMEIGSNMHYSIYLRTGTRKMAERKMSDDALREGMRSARRLGRWVEFTRSGLGRS